MKEKLERICNSFKSGVMIWIVSYLLLYVVSRYAGSFSIYNENVMKLLDVKNFIAQLFIAGFTYTILEVVLLHFIDNMIKSAEKEKNKVKEVVNSFVIAIIIIALLCVVLYILKEKNIISKYILKLMMTVIALKAVFFELNQVIKTNRYNKKLKEKNK